MANPEIPGNAPQNNLGVKGMNRGNLINFLLFKDFVGGGKKGKKGGGGGAVAQGGGRTRREMKNDMKMLRFQYELQDEYERAQTARAVEKAAQTDANAYQAADAFFGGGTIEGVSGAHTPKQIQNVEARPKKGNFKGAGGTSAGWEYADEQLGGEEPTQGGTEGGGDQEDIDPNRPFDKATRRKGVRSSKGKPGSVRVIKQGLTDSQLEEANADFEDYRKSQMEDVANLGEQWDDTYEDEIKGNYIAQKFPMEDRELKGLTADQKRAHKDWIRETPTPADNNPVGTVNEDASIDTGEVGNRPAPGGQNGVAKGPQFNQ